MNDVIPWIEELRYAHRHRVVRRGLVAVIAALSVWVVAAVALWSPASRELDQLRADIASKRRQMVEQKFREDLAEVAKQAEQDIKDIERKLERDGVQVILVDALGRLAKKHGVRIESESYEAGRAQGKYQPLHHDLALSGSYRGLKSFLIALADLPTYTVVQEAAFSSPSRSSRVKVNLRLTTFQKATGAEKPGENA